MGLIGTPILEVADAALAGLDLDIEKKSKAETWKELASQAKRAMASTDQAARMEVNEYKEEYGSGVSTLIRIYNASGCTLRFEESKHDSGRWDKYQPDGEIQNGQWSVCLHVKKSGAATGSCAAMKYQVMTNEWDIKEEHNLIIGWETPYSGFNSGLACVVGQLEFPFHPHDWAEAQTWSTIHGKAENKVDNQQWMTFGAEPLAARFQTGQSSSPMFTCVIGRTDVV